MLMLSCHQFQNRPLHQFLVWEPYLARCVSIVVESALPPHSLRIVHKTLVICQGGFSSRPFCCADGRFGKLESSQLTKIAINSSNESQTNGVLPVSLQNPEFCRGRGEQGCTGRFGIRHDQLPGTLASGSEHVQHTVAVSFGGLQPITEIQELILRRTALHVVDGSAHVSNQALQL
jgi:hypothetical protein